MSEKLKAQKISEVVKDHLALKVLELAIQHAETGWNPENERDDVWSLLFPIS